MRKPHSLLYFCVLVVTVCAFGVSNAWSLTIEITGPNDFSDGPKPCPHGGAPWEGEVRGHLNTTATTEYSEVFVKAWGAWNDAQPAGQKWNLVHYPNLEGTLEIRLFDTFNNCTPDGNQMGVEVSAFFDPVATDPCVADLRWVQGFSANQSIHGPWPHNSSADPVKSEMDVLSGSLDPNVHDPPLYPWQYPDPRYAPGEFYDRPEMACLANEQIFFDAVALLVEIDRPNRKLYVYEGFSYGFDIFCIPEPATLLLLGLGLVLLRRRRG